jgi:hypothetical protein
MQLAAREGATGRPEEVLDQLGLQPYDARLRTDRPDFYVPSTHPISTTLGIAVVGARCAFATLPMNQSCHFTAIPFHSIICLSTYPTRG